MRDAGRATAADPGAPGRAGEAGLAVGRRPDGAEVRRELGTAKVRLLWCSLIALALFAVAFPAVAAPPTVWTAPDLVRIGPDEAAGSTTDIQVYAAKGETESFQILVKAPAGGLTNVNVIAPNLGGPQLTLYREYYAYLSSGSPDYASNVNKPGGAGWYPDGLIPFVNPDTGQDLSGALDAVPFSLAAGKNQPIWVDVSVPRTTAAGSYTGTFQITSNQGTASVTLHLTVWNFTLPLQPAMKSLFRYMNATYSRASQPARELIRHRLMPQFVNTTEERTLIDNYGLNGIDVPFYSNASLSTGYIAPAPSAATFQAEAANHQPDLPLYCYMADEIGWYTAFYPTIRDWGRNMHTAGIDNLITMMPDPALYDDGSGTGRSAVDFWVVLPKQYDQVPDRMQYVISKGDEGWSYNCVSQDGYSPKWLLDYAPVNYRLQPGFINQSLNLTGLLYWAVDFWGSDPWNNPMPWSPFPAEGLLVYPGDQVGLPGQTIGSMRLKYLRDGVDDYDYIQLLREQGQGDWAVSVARTVGPDWRDWTRDPNAVEAARRQLGEELDSLGGGTTPHELSVSASVSPSTVASGGQAALSATATDSQGHGIASWSWSDGGAGGTFSSPTAQNPTYTAAENTSGADRAVTLTVTAVCDGSPARSATAEATLTVQPARPPTEHALTVSAAASPTQVASGGTTALTASATDSLGHTVTSWTWSDGGAGGTFSSTTAQSPSYEAPANTSGGTMAVTLTVTATCNQATPVATGTAAVTITVEPVPGETHTLTVSAAASPTQVASGGTTALTASATDSLGHTVTSWSWSDGGAGGTFSSTTAQSPSYEAPANTSGGTMAVTLTVTATCNQATPAATGTAAATITVEPVPGETHTLTVTAAVMPVVIAAGGQATLEATATDSVGHEIASWSWSDGGVGGTFTPSAEAQNPTYAPPAESAGIRIALHVTVTCSGSPAVSGEATAALSVAASFPGEMTDVPADYWAYPYIKACLRAGLMGGYPDGTFRPRLRVTRDHMAAYIARGIAGDDSQVPAGPRESRFSDIPPDHWALKYIEYLAGLTVVLGYPDGTYRPEGEIDRAQLAVYMARAVATPRGESGLEGYVPPSRPTFSDVWRRHWAYSYIENIAAQGIVQGYDNGTYRPRVMVTRDQMAVYLARAFELPL